MKPKPNTKAEADKLVRNIKRATRQKFSRAEKIRLVLADRRGEGSIVELCRREGFHQNLHYSWSKEFLEVRKKHLAEDTEREASRDDSELCRESTQLKEASAETTPENRLLKKSVLGNVEDAL